MSGWQLDMEAAQSASAAIAVNEVSSDRISMTASVLDALDNMITHSVS